ncbi:MAG: type III polyketide synthase [Opitutaceae bacterium]
MYLHALATALPDEALSQSQCWELFERSPARLRLNRRSRLILHNLFHGKHGIDRRHFAVPDMGRIFDLTPDELNAAFREAAPRLAAQALRRALDRTGGLRAAKLDALIVCTCTGYLCPGLTSYVAELTGMREDAFLQDLVGLGCGAALPSLRAAGYFLAAHPDATVACIAVEICSAAFFLDDDPGVLVSASLFADGAAATIWRAAPGPTPLRARDFDTIHRPDDRDKLRFEMRGGKLRNLLDRAVPELAAEAVSCLWRRRGPRPVSRVCSHSGGADVLTALSAALPDHSLAASEKVLRTCGNMSSPTVLFALEETLRTGALPDASADFWLVSFGAGFSAHSCRLAAG